MIPRLSKSNDRVLTPNHAIHRVAIETNFRAAMRTMLRQTMNSTWDRPQGMHPYLVQSKCRRGRSHSHRSTRIPTMRDFSADLSAEIAFSLEMSCGPAAAAPAAPSSASPLASPSPRSSTSTDPKTRAEVPLVGAAEAGEAEDSNSLYRKNASAEPNDPRPHPPDARGSVAV